MNCRSFHSFCRVFSRQFIMIFGHSTRSRYQIRMCARVCLLQCLQNYSCFLLNPENFFTGHASPRRIVWVVVPSALHSPRMLFAHGQRHSGDVYHVAERRKAEQRHSDSWNSQELNIINEKFQFRTTFVIIVRSLNRCALSLSLHTIVIWGSEMERGRATKPQKTMIQMCAGTCFIIMSPIIFAYDLNLIWI